MTSHSKIISLDSFPNLILENLLTYFSCKEVSTLKSINRSFEALCVHHLEKHTEILKRRIANQEDKIWCKSCKLPENTLRATDCIVKYYILQLIHNEVNIILYNQRLLARNYIPGVILDYLNCIIREIQKENADAQLLLDLYKTCFLFDKTYFRSQFAKPLNLTYFGVEIMNFLHIMKDLKYVVIVTYDKELQTCLISAEYNLLDFKISNYLLFLTKISAEKEHYTLSNDEKNVLLKLLLIIVKSHNCVTIYKNIYCQMIEMTANTNNLFLNENVFDELSECRKRTITEKTIREVYKNVDDEEIIRDGLWCQIQLQCAAQDAPHKIYNFWKKLLLSKLVEEKTNMATDHAYNFEIQFLINLHTFTALSRNMYEFKEIFSKEHNEKIAQEFPSLKDNYYLEHLGATLYSDTQLRDVFEELKSNLFGNPHAFNTSSTFTEDIVYQVRSHILQHFKTTQDEYTVIFTSGATGALKIVAETFNYTENKINNGILVYLQDNHTSVMGMRQHAKQFKVLRNDDAFKMFNSNTIEFPNIQSSVTTNSLFVYPAQSNFSGTKYPLNWVEKVQKGALKKTIENNLQNEPTKWFCMLDAASFVSSNELDLKLYKPDFVCISFYKIFGYPTGLGALIVKNSSAHVLQKKYFGGGTVQMAVDEEHIFRQSLHERFEDGTLPFLSIISLRHGFKTLQRLSLTMNTISEHTFNLAKYVHHNLLTMHHSNDQPVAILYHDTDFEDQRFQGGVVNFNLFRSNGKYVGYSEVLQMANLYKIHLRTGCFCNPGACQKHLKLSPIDVKHQYKSGHVCGDQNDLIEGKPTGSVRISFGYMSRKIDADKLLQMIENCFVTEPLLKKLPKSWKNFQKDCGNKFISQSPKYISPLNCNNNNDGKELLNNKMMTKIEHNLINNGNVLPLNNLQNRIELKTTTEFLSTKVQGTLRYIFLYPIKSCGAYSVTENWEIYSMGLKYDREWMIATIAGVCLTQKQEPKLCLLTPNIYLDKGVLEMSFPGMPTITVPLQVNEADITSELSICQSKICGKRVACIDCGDEIANWLSEAFQRSDLRLFRQNNDYIRTNQKHQTQLSLVNEAQYLLINIASIKHLANIMPNYEGTIIDLVLRFRANLVVKTDVSFVEQSCRQVRIGDTNFKSTGPCTRCQMICIDQVTAKKTVEPLRTLSTFAENRIRFGVYLSHENGAIEQPTQLSVNETVIFE